MNHTQIHSILQTWTLKFFVVLLLSIIWIQTEANLILVLISVFFSGIIGVIHQKKESILCPGMLHFLRTNHFLPKIIFKGRICMQQIFWDSLNSSSSADSNSNLGLWEYFWEFCPDFHATNSVNSESVSPIQICPDLSNSKFT